MFSFLQNVFEIILKSGFVAKPIIVLFFFYTTTGWCQTKKYYKWCTFYTKLTLLATNESLLSLYISPSAELSRWQAAKTAPVGLRGTCSDAVLAPWAACLQVNVGAARLTVLVNSRVCCVRASICFACSHMFLPVLSYYCSTCSQWRQWASYSDISVKCLQEDISVFWTYYTTNLLRTL